MIDGVHGKGDEVVGIGEVYEADYVAGDSCRQHTYIVNVVVNCIGTNSIANFAENYTDWLHETGRPTANGSEMADRNQGET